MVKWLHEKGFHYDRLAASEAAAHVGDLEILMWVHQNCNFLIGENTLITAVQENHLHVVQWLYEKQVSCDFFVFDLCPFGTF
jgi:hypothetical protein